MSFRRRENIMKIAYKKPTLTKSQVMLQAVTANGGTTGPIPTPTPT